jgi:hypothetical protein
MDINEITSNIIKAASINRKDRWTADKLQRKPTERRDYQNRQQLYIRLARGRDVSIMMLSPILLTNKNAFLCVLCASARE